MCVLLWLWWQRNSLRSIMGKCANEPLSVTSFLSDSQMTSLRHQPYWARYWTWLFTWIIPFKPHDNRISWVLSPFMYGEMEAQKSDTSKAMWPGHNWIQSLNSGLPTPEPSPVLSTTCSLKGQVISYMSSTFYFINTKKIILKLKYHSGKWWFLQKVYFLLHG